MVKESEPAAKEMLAGFYPHPCRAEKFLTLISTPPYIIQMSEHQFTKLSLAQLSKSQDIYRYSKNSYKYHSTPGYNIFRHIMCK